MQERLNEFRREGAHLVAVSSNPPDSSLTLKQKHDLDFHVLSDSGYVVMRRFGVVYELTPELDSLYANFGRDLRGLQKTEKAELPLAATYVIDRNGIIRYAYLDVDYTRRAEPDSVLAALRRVGK